MRRAAAIYLGAALLAVYVILRAWDHFRGRPYAEAPLWRHEDPEICHARWCWTTRSGRPDDCDCSEGWAA